MDATQHFDSGPSASAPGRQGQAPDPAQVRIVNCLPLTDQERARFQQAGRGAQQRFIADASNRDQPSWKMDLPADLVQWATVVIGNPPAAQVASCGSLEWLQTATAGVDAYQKEGVLPSGAMLSGASGAFGQSVSEHMFALMWSLMKGLGLYRDQQRLERWGYLGQALSPRGATVLVVGTGDLGSHFACLAQAVGAKTLGVRRSPEHPAEGIDAMHGFDELDDLLPRADVVALAVPASPDTHHLIDARRLDLMSPQAILINGGRGDAVDCAALSQALEEGSIRGAGLDVTEPEPLPAGHPLWRQERCVITPHVSGGTNLSANGERIVAIALDNLTRYMQGRALRNRER
ncbi:hydroxyacid dehydrogenase catalytic domain protein [Bifidobacterium actinocoloniiforme DSM 22766]|uniref:Hydroxyacid dehydrogenase catalytic domain protein n=1 Tax=Bifidobacterium actinocoloniiforme DSM 22766 TaxID=1437605 RepID=A0A086Z0A3_9BIFI|nr:D-2-hydroxyacid dehydrogenase [Bifidobacterium actinocoloniiforme]KFI39953.1 hydroxyacid dehydrogenase catalytic domain protein [Bifidobacterium actinocoloniiforme DSM 22766]